MRAKIYDPENRKWWTLGAVAFGLFMIMLDNTIVNVALPAMALVVEHRVVDMLTGTPPPSATPRSC